MKTQALMAACVLFCLHIRVLAQSSNTWLFTHILHSRAEKIWLLSGESDIADATNYNSSAPEYNINIAYINFNDNSNSSTGKMIAMKFDIRDGGATNSDADATPTILSALSISVKDSAGQDRASAIGYAVLTNQLGTFIKEATISASQLSFSGMSGTEVTAADGGTKRLHLRIALNAANITDNEKLIFSIASATADAAGSLFASANAGAATTDSSTANDRNRIEVTATMLGIVQQPSNTNQFASMWPEPTAEAKDPNGLRDKDYTSSISLLSSGTLQVTPVTGVWNDGLAFFYNLVHTSPGSGFTLTISSGSFAEVVSNSFDIGASTSQSAYFKTKTGLVSGNWNDAGCWEYSTDNSNWLSSTLAPNSSALGIRIQSGATITLATHASAKLLLVDAGAELIHSNGIVFTMVNDGTALGDMIVNGRYELNGTQPALGAGVLVEVNSGGEVNAASNNGGESDDFARHPQVYFYQGAVFRWSLSTPFQASGYTYFPNAIVGNIATFKVVAPIGLPIGGSGNLTINGLLETTASISFTGSGDKVFRNGINNSAPLTQNTGSGRFIINGQNSLIGGNGLITLNNTSGLEIASGTCTVGGNKTIDGGSIAVLAGALLDVQAYSIGGNSMGLVNNAGTIKTSSLNGLYGAVGAAFGPGWLGLNLSSGSTIEYAATTGTQTLTPRNDYKNLVVSGGSYKQLDGTATIDESLMLNHGIVGYANASSLISLSASASCTGGSINSFINGPLARQYNASGQSFTYPVGKTSPVCYRPFSFTTTNAMAGTLRGEYFTGNTPEAGSDFFLSYVMAIVSNGYWMLEKTSGATEGKITFDYINPGNGNWRAANGGSLNPCADCNVALVQRSTGSGPGNWDFPNPNLESFSTSGNPPEARYYLDNGPIISKTLTSFGPFAFGLSYNYILPLQLISFTVKPHASGHLLQWSIDSDEEILAFELQHSSNGRQFQSIATLPSNGRQYQYVHTRVRPGKNFYRLLIKNKNHSNTYSKIIVLSKESTALQILNLQVYSSQQLVLSIYSPRVQTTMASLSDAMGRVLMHKAIPLSAGGQLIYLSMPAESKGVLFLSILDEGGSTHTYKFMKP